MKNTRVITPINKRIPVVNSDFLNKNLLKVTKDSYSSSAANPQFVQSLLPLRGIACLIVFLFHLFCVSGGYYENQGFVDFFRFGKYGVHMFFVISGFVITHSFLLSNYKVKNYFTFLKKRIIRIEPAYIITLLIGIGYTLSRNIFISENALFDNLNFMEILAHVGYVVPFFDYTWLNIVFWTLAVEFQFYLIFALLFPLI